MPVDLGPLRRLLARIAAILERAGVPYAVVGGLAVNLQGEMRETKDLDCTIAMTEDRLRELGAEFEREGFVVSHHGGPGAPMARWMRLEDPTANPPIRTDMILATDGLWQATIRRAVLVRAEGRIYPVATPEDLILLKLKAGRLQDLFDAASVIKVQRLRKAALDTAYLDGEATRWGVGEPWRKLREAMKE